jgi:Ca-activated chloride channel family protein
VVVAVSTAAPAAQQSGDDVVLDTELVTLDVSVVDKGNRPVFDIGEERFQIAEDGAPQKIAFFSKEKAAVSLAIAVDTSGSMRSKLDSVVQATSNLVRASAPNDETAVIQFKDQVELVEEFTTDIGDVEDALNDLVSSGQTSLLDALMLAADYSQKDGRNRRKALVVVTDGLEKGSFYSLDEVTDHLRKLDVRLYLIGFTTDLNDSAGLFKKSQKEKAEALLHKLAEDTGGRAFFPSDESQLGPVIDQIALDLRTVYAIGYYPTNTKKDGTFRKVSVTVLGPDRKADSKLSARTRAGYMAAKQ